MSSARLERTDVAVVRRLPRRYPYLHTSPAAPGPSSEPSSASAVSSAGSLEARNDLASAFRAPRRMLAAPCAPLEFTPVVRAEHGFPVPRNELVNTLLSKEDKLKAARRLVECALNILSSGWKIVETTPFPGAANPSHPGLTPYDGLQYPYQATAEHMPLHKFVHEVLRRSCTHFFTLQTAMSYLEIVVAQLPALVKEEAKLILKPGYVPRANDGRHEARAMPSPLLCPRRTFLASLLLASKFLHDRSYTSKSWAKLTGLHAREVGRSERALWAALDYRLWHDKDSGPVVAIAELDTKPVIALSVAYVPEPESAPPQMLRTIRRDVALTFSVAVVDGPTPQPDQRLPRPSLKALAASSTLATIDESVAGRSTLSNASSLDLPPMLTHVSAELPHPLSRWQDAYPDGVTSPSQLPGLPHTSPSSADFALKLDPSTAQGMNAGPRGRLGKDR